MNKIFVTLVMMTLTTMLSARPIVLRGKVGGDIRSRVALLSLYGDTLKVSDMQRGAFELSYEGEDNMYKISIGRWCETFYLKQDTLTISGYVDREGNDHDLSIKGLSANHAIKQAYEQTSGAMLAYDRWLNDTVLTISEEAARTETNICLHANRTHAGAKALVQWVNAQHDAGVAAAGAWKAGATLPYEDMRQVADALPQEAWQTEMGKVFDAALKNAAQTADGAKAPDFTVQDEKGNALQLSSLRGNIVLIDFWASWCGPCRKEMVYLKELYKELEGKPVKFISISLDDRQGDWLRAAEEEQIPWLSGWDKEGFTQSRLRQNYNFQQIPFCMVLDKEGRIVGKELRRSQLKKAINETINKK